MAERGKALRRQAPLRTLMPEIDGLRTHGDDDHARDNLDGVCEECQTDHRVVESLPNQPLDPSKIEAIEDTDGVVFARSVLSVPGAIVGSTADKITEDIVLATEKSVRTVTRYGDSGGWIVKQDLPVPENREPREFALDVYEAVRAEFDDIDEDDVEREDLIQQ